MKTIIIKTQTEFDALPDSFIEYTCIELHGNITVTKDRESSHVEARGSSHVEAWGSSHVVAWESSHVEAWGSSHVVARGSSHVEAWGSSHVVAWESSHVVARGSSHVEAWGSSVVIDGLFFWSVLTMCFCVCKVLKKHSTATIVKQVRKTISKSMFLQTLEKCAEGYILYKSVRPDTLCDFQTGKIKYEGVVSCPDWDSNPNRECGGGLHLSPTPGMALSYHTGKLLKCAVKPSDFVIYQDGDFTKVRCKRVTVLGEVK